MPHFLHLINFLRSYLWFFPGSLTQLGKPSRSFSKQALYWSPTTEVFHSGTFHFPTLPCLLSLRLGIAVIPRIHFPFLSVGLPFSWTLCFAFVGMDRLCTVFSKMTSECPVLNLACQMPLFRSQAPCVTMDVDSRIDVVFPYSLEDTNP